MRYPAFCWSCRQLVDTYRSRPGDQRRYVPHDMLPNRACPSGGKQIHDQRGPYRKRRRA